MASRNPLLTGPSWSRTVLSSLISAPSESRPTWVERIESRHEQHQPDVRSLCAKWRIIQMAYAPVGGFSIDDPGGPARGRVDEPLGPMLAHMSGSIASVNRVPVSCSLSLETHDDPSRPAWRNGRR